MSFRVEFTVGSVAKMFRAALTHALEQAEGRK